MKADYTLKKSLGQHFLVHEETCRNIVDALGSYSGPLLEIGPGAGALTTYLIQNPQWDLHCIELDREKVQYLLKHYPALQSRITEADFLKMECPFPGTFRIIGNFPYNISSQILFRVLDWRDQVEAVVGMFQKEVAVRITSKHGNKDYGILSVLIQTYYETEYLFDVPAARFQPPPKVESGVLLMKRKWKDPEGLDYNRFRQFVKTAFNQRRKTLRNGFRSWLKPDQLKESIFDKRAEQLSINEFVQLFQSLYPPGEDFSNTTFTE